ncbi:hypothetical protein AB0B51_37310, partial [Streptomyces griseus]
MGFFSPHSWQPLSRDAHARSFASGGGTV